jgi:hypothetical protein
LNGSNGSERINSKSKNRKTDSNTTIAIPGGRGNHID